MFSSLTLSIYQPQPLSSRHKRNVVYFPNAVHVQVVLIGTVGKPEQNKVSKNNTQTIYPSKCASKLSLV